MLIEPLMATVESARRYEVVSDEMQAAQLLARQWIRLVARLLPRPGQSSRANQRTGAVAFLARVPLFRDLNKSQLQSLARLSVPRHYAAGEAIVKQGQGGIGFFVVVSGKAEAVWTRLDGTRVVVNTFGPTDFFGELAVLNDQPRTASVVALEDTECLVLARWDFHGKLMRHKEMAAVILQEQSRRFQKVMSVL